MKTLQALALSALLSATTTAPALDVITPPTLQMPSYESGSVVVLCADTGLVLYGYEQNEPFYPASITKVMAALVVLDHVQDLNERITFSYHSIFSIPRNSSHISMDVGETLTVYQALNAIMVRSANEVTIALAEHVAGSEEAFVTLMNHRATAVGAMNTHFVNATGLPANNHVTTAYDMALIMREAVRPHILHGDTFAQIITKPQFAIPPTERQPETRFLNTTNQLIRRGTPYYNPHVIGSKTGWTHAAGNTLVTYAQHNDRRLIVSILQGTGTDPFRETSALLNFAFNLPFEEQSIFNASSYTRTIPITQDIDGETTTIYQLTLQAREDITHSLPVNFDFSQLRYELSVPSTLTTPITAGDILGSVAIFAQDVYLTTAHLRAQSTVLTKTPTPEVQVPDTIVYEEETVPAYLSAIPPTEVDPNATPMGIFLENIRYGEQLEQLAVPLTVGFFGLLFTIIAFVARRKRRDRYHYSRYANMYRYRSKF